MGVLGYLSLEPMLCSLLQWTPAPFAVGKYLLHMMHIAEASMLMCACFDLK